MFRLLASFALVALSLPALADEPLLKSRATSQPPLVPSAYRTAPQEPPPASEPATAAEAAEEKAQAEAAQAEAAQAGAAAEAAQAAAPAREESAPQRPAPAAAAPAPVAELEDDGPDVLFGGGTASGGFGGLVLRTSKVAGDAAVLVGGRGAWLIDHRLALGFAGYGLASDVPIYDPADGRNKFVELAYGGFFASYSLFPGSVVHVSLDGLVGAGATTYSRRYYAWDSSDGIDETGDGFFVGEVGANVVVNLARFARLSIGPGWRFVNGARYRKLRSDDFAGPQGSIMLDFGKF